MEPELDWVEIPTSLFLLGLSDEQRQTIRTQLHVEFGLNGMDSGARRVLDGLAAKYRRTAREEAYSVTDDLTEEERRFKHGFDDPLFSYLLAEAELERIPPQRQLFVRTFYISRFPITHAQCDAFFASDFAHRNGYAERPKYSSKELADMPEETSWAEADVMAHWFGGRLPTAFEWEKAARGIDGRLYPWGNDWNPANGNFDYEHRPNYSKEQGTRTTVVDAYPGGVSPYGVWDMLGNLREWTMTRIIPKKANEEYAVAKGESAKEVGEPNWFWSMSARQPLGHNYVGFRPVLSDWQRRHWVRV